MNFFNNFFFLLGWDLDESEEREKERERGGEDF